MLARRSLIGAVVALSMMIGLASGPGLAAGHPTARTDRSGTNGFFEDAFPAIPYWIVVKQPDGHTFRARLNNAEIGGHMETEAGYTVTKGSDGWWYYASSADGSKVTASKLRAGIDAPRGLAKGLGRIADIWSGDLGSLRDQTLRALQMASYKAQMRAVASGALPFTFRTPFLMLATYYDPSKGETQPTFQPGHDAAYFEKFLDGFGGNPTGTMTEFWLENSYGQFFVDVDVYGPYMSYRSMNNPCYYGNISPEYQKNPVDGSTLDVPGVGPVPRVDDGDPAGNALGVGGLGAVGMAMEAVPQADKDVDFGKYDNDGDGKVDFMGIIHSGGDMAGTGDPCMTWSHANTVTFGAGLLPEPVKSTVLAHGGLPTSDTDKNPDSNGAPVVIDRVFTMPEVGLGIGVAVHEMMHARGEPDYYNTSYLSQGTGDWDIMAGGSWFGVPLMSNPMGPNPATRVFQGWVTPKVVHDDLRNVTLRPREVAPFKGYDASQVDPNIVLVPVEWTDSTAPKDVYGLVKDPQNGKYITQGWYIEFISRSVTTSPLVPQMTRSPYFDRQAHGSGLMIWHFDYYKKSNVYYGANNAQNDPNRPQMDPEEFDFNDNTQELQLNYTRGEPSDVWFNAATGMTTATRQNPPGIPTGGTPQAGTSGSGVLAPGTKADYPFTVANNPANYQMTATVTGLGDCTLALLHKESDGQFHQVGSIDSGGAGDTETLTIFKPKTGDWLLRVGDFAACTQHDWTVSFKLPFFTMGAADTWTNQGDKTGWTFTNIGPHDSDQLEHAADAPGPEVITLDLLKLGAGDVDVSPGFVTTSATSTFGRGPIAAGTPSTIVVPVFNNGGKAAHNVAVAVHEGSPAGPVIASTTIGSLAGYGREDVSFTWTPSHEGKTDLFTVVDPAGSIAEAEETNNLQKSTVVVGTAGARVLVVDDEGSEEFQDTYLGALSALHVPWAYAQGHVDAATMKQYQAVIWEAGEERYAGQLNELDRAEIAKYLNGGGKLWMSSPRLASALGDEPSGTNPGATPEMPKFLHDYFGADLVDTAGVGGGTVTGTNDASGIGKSMNVKLELLPGRPLQDIFEVASGDEASSLGTAHPLLDWSLGHRQGIRVDGKNGFKTVYFGFNLAQVISSEQQVTLTDQILKWFGVSEGGYTPSASVIFHYAKRVRSSGQATPLTVFSPGSVPRVMYRAHMRGGWNALAMTATSVPGLYQATIDGKWSTPIGIDYFIDAAETSPDQAPSLAHYVAVQLPQRMPPAAAGTKVLGKRTTKGLPATGVGSNAMLAWLAIVLATGLGAWTRRRTA